MLDDQLAVGGQCHLLFRLLRTSGEQHDLVGSDSRHRHGRHLRGRDRRREQGDRRPERGAPDSRPEMLGPGARHRGQEYGDRAEDGTEELV